MIQSIKTMTQITQNNQIPQNGYDTRLRRRMLALQKQQNVNSVSLSKRHYYLRSTRPLYEVNIDFDEASAAWNRNKRRVGQSYEYIS